MYGAGFLAAPFALLFRIGEVSDCDSISPGGVDAWIWKRFRHFRKSDEAVIDDDSCFYREKYSDANQDRMTVY